jgi:choline monooxygenase
VTRDQAGDLRAFLNVCRHRGSEIASGAGRRETLQCPYHAWTYGLDGALRSAPRAEREAGVDPAALGLVPLRLDEWGPFLFANADPGATPLAETLMPARLPFDPAALVFRGRVDYAIDANWKIAVENYLECYHCPVAHPGFSRLVDVDPDSYVLAGDGPVWSQYGQARDGNGTCAFHLVWPGLKINLYPGFPNLSIGPVWPESPGRTVGFLDYFFGPDVDVAWADELVAFDDQVGREDTALVESAQRGVQAGLIQKGHLLRQSERLIVQFQEKVTHSLT